MNDQELIRQIITQIADLPDYGQLQIHVKRHLGSFSNTDYVKMTTLRYSNNEPNVSLTTDILRMIKQIADSKLNGTLGFSASFKHGRADLMQVQDFKKL